MSMTFEHWFEHELDQNDYWAMPPKEVARKAWSACLEHARDDFFQREIDRLRADAPPTLESGVSAHKERFYSYHPDARRPYCIAALEYLKEQK